MSNRFVAVFVIMAVLIIASGAETYDAIENKAGLSMMAHGLYPQ